MNRSGYTDDMDDVLAHGRWRGQVASAQRGKRGQAFLREILAALDEMPVKELIANSFAAPSGDFCTLGAVGAQRGGELVNKLKSLDDEGWYCAEEIAAALNIPHALAAEIMHENDDGWWDGPYGVDESPEHRWQRMRKYIAGLIKESGDE